MFYSVSHYLYCPNFVAQIVLALAIRSAFGLASACSGHTHLVFGGLACFLTMQDAPGSPGVIFATVLDQLFLLDLLSRHVCAPTHVCTNICIHVISLSCECVRVDVTNVCSYHAETSHPCPTTQRSLCPFFPLPYLEPISLIVRHLHLIIQALFTYFFSPVPGAHFFSFFSLFGN